MSSTNRGYSRHKSDYYVTPQWAIRDMWKEVSELIHPNIILDHCSGGDSNHEMSYPSVISNIITNDIRKDSPSDYHEDYLKWKLTFKPDLIITNPPFYLAQEFIEKALNDISEEGVVVMLLRLNFLGSQKRFKFWQEHMPNYTFVHSKRLSFTDDNKTDSIEYMRCVWIPSQRHKGATKLRVI